MAEVFGHPLAFGLGFNRPLPEGWRLEEKPDDWARAIAPSGKVYLLGKNKAYLYVDGQIDLKNFVWLPGQKELEKKELRRWENS